MEIDSGALDRLIDAVRETNEKLETYIFRAREADSNVLVSCKEAARLLGVNPSTISIMLQQHRLRKAYIDGSTGIRLSEIRDMIKPQ